MISSPDPKAEQQLSKAMARNPLVLLDHQLQSLGKSKGSGKIGPQSSGKPGSGTTR